MRRQNVKFIEELDPVRKRRIQNTTRSLSGIIPSAKNEEEVWFESALERDFALILESHPDVSHYQEQPISIEYYYNGKNRIYTPDFLVFFNEGSNLKPWLCEIKYRSELREKFSKLKPRFHAAKITADKEKWEFKIFTEHYIRTAYLHNINFLSRYNYNELDGACYELVIRTLSDLGHSSPKEFMLTVQDAHFNLKGRCLYALWYGIKNGDIGCDIVTEKLNMNSEIWLSEKLNFKPID
ncbi:MAG: TnsA endonuclease N-terminal domain-containing protein [bacterium]|nr:TnsA endonuclease N-terminal domain-containing protein [bacterium]